MIQRAAGLQHRNIDKKSESIIHHLRREIIVCISDNLYYTLNCFLTSAL